MLYDQHLHSNHSFDCETEPRENVLAAIENGLAGLTFTEHFDPHPDEWADCIYDDDAYSATIALLRQEFGRQIFIGKGIEVCFQPDRMDFTLDFLANHQFDLIVLSVHWAGGHPIHDREVIKQWGASESSRLYLEAVLEAARFCRRLNESHGRRVFDVLGHPDFIKRYTARYLNETCIDEYGGLLEAIVLACLEADLTPEVNTSTLRSGLSDPMPGPSFVERYAAAGGQAMSIGSDAHLAKSIGAGFDVVTEMLRRAGINDMAVFRGRERQQTPITIR